MSVPKIGESALVHAKVKQKSASQLMITVQIDPRYNSQQLGDRRWTGFLVADE